MSSHTGKAFTFSTLRPWLITAAAFAGVVLLVIWLSTPTGSASSDEGKVRGRPGMGLPGGVAGMTVSVSKVERADLDVHYHALGTVTAFNTVNIKPRVSGELVKVLFTEGQEVKAGDLLAVVDPRAYRAALAQAEGTLQQNRAQLKNAEIDLERYRGLYAEDSIAKQTLDTQAALLSQYEGTLKTNQGQVDDAKLNLAFTEIRAPISGRLGLRQVDVGNLVSSSDTTPLVVITQVRPIAVVFNLPQQQLGTVVRQLNANQALPVEALDRNKDLTLARGELIAVDNQIDTTTGTVKLKAQFANKSGDNADRSLFPNQFVNVRLLAETLHDVLLIPANAVQRGNDGTYVYVLGEGDKVSQRAITLGISEGEKVVVEKGLAVAEQVVIEGTDRLRDGMSVRVAAAEQVQKDQGEEAGQKPFGQGDGASQSATSQGTEGKTGAAQ
ncbi:MdtA/MuxA family multidrug efflux RND transporter periplasmic adaptor subunit [Pseudomonas cavernicola]|uniref:MdtA/MuxA family multidrug efflux RND transporter periplasmic adaptor subunit n=1 Tax=Pseudomonas cavernicola TaxID=2320866 RepID=A0A418XA05_9PSED|nr:MdtA/MuxA family multidrug efflux RND transporter periplasmic adaptor subunit [Pseudomonas cavernicola]RJG09314.1 MdtA/MuxA family multidrug efflux RND transporter periplasmic adaptor subunit [Pseudomonas cavernicola]